MRRLFAMLFLLSFSITHAVATPFATCRHADGAAHAAALASDDAATAAAAHEEESAAAAAVKKGAPADAPAPVLNLVVMPSGPLIPTRPDAKPAAWGTAATGPLRDRPVSPLLQPPLA
ncbi:MAG TPA: hypothetical protein VMG08_19380 [Allosphingosinicella sp.]|nr:hypothetical protein [Allosphingosinicella sp.]